MLVRASPPNGTECGWGAAVRRSLDRIMELFPDGDVPGRIDGTSAAAKAPRPRRVGIKRTNDIGSPRQSTAQDRRIAAIFLAPDTDP